MSENQVDAAVPGRRNRRLAFFTVREAPNAPRQFIFTIVDEIAETSKAITIDLAEAAHFSDVLTAAVRKP